MGKMNGQDFNEALLSATVRQLLINSDDFIFMVDTELVYRMVSDSMVRLVNGRRKEDVLGKTDFDIFPKALAEKYRADDRKVLETGSPIIGVTERLPDKQGKERWTKTWKFPVYDKQGKLTGLYGISRDVTRLINGEEIRRPDRQYSRRRRHSSPEGRTVLSRLRQRRILFRALHESGIRRALHRHGHSPQHLRARPETDYHGT